MMKPRQREQLRRALEQRREALVAELELESPLQRPQVDAGEAADEKRDVQELRDIEAARQRLDEGTYGKCTDCGAAIGFERLQVEPQAARCIGCQRRFEKAQRR